MERTLMRGLVLVLVFALAPSVFAQEPVNIQPLVRVNIRTMQELTASLANTVNAVQPGAGMQVQAMVPMMIGSPMMAGIDQNRPITCVIGFISQDAPPVIAVFVPVTDYDAFVKGLMPGSKIKASPDGDNYFEKIGQTAMVVIRAESAGMSSLDEPCIKAARTWAPGGVKPGHLVTVEFMVGPVREIALMGLTQLQAMAAMGVGMAAPDMGGDPQVMAQMVGFYFEALRGLLTDADSLGLELDIDAKGIRLALTLAALKDSAFAKNLMPSDVDAATVAGWLDPVSQFSFIGVMGGAKDSFMREWAAKVMPLSFKMQGIGVEDAKTLTDATSRAMDIMFPSAYTFAMDFGARGFEFVGAYKLTPERAAGALDAMQPFFDLVKKTAGPDKLYTRAAFTRDVRKAGAVSVSRLELDANPDNPQAMGLQMIGMMKMVFDYAVVGDTLITGTPARLDAFISANKPAAAPAGLVVPRGLVAKGAINLVEFMKGIAAIVPDGGDEIGALAGMIDAKGTELGISVICDGRGALLIDVPLVLLSRVGEAFMKIQMQQMQMGADEVEDDAGDEGDDDDVEFGNF